MEIIPRLIAAAMILFFGMGFVGFTWILWVQLKDSLDTMGAEGRKKTMEKFMSGDWSEDE